MYWCTHRPKPAAAHAVMNAARDPVRRQTSMPRHMTVPASIVITTSAFALRLHRTSDGGPRIRNAVAIHAIAARKQPLDEHELEADEQGEARERHALERDDARAGDGKHRRREVHLRDALVALSPEKRGMLAPQHVAGHQPFDGLVGVEKAVAVEEKRRPADDDERRDEKKLEKPAAVSRPAG